MRHCKAIIGLLLGVILGLCSMCVCGYKHRTMTDQSPPPRTNQDSTETPVHEDSLEAQDSSAHPPSQEGLPIKKPMLE